MIYLGIKIIIYIYIYKQLENKKQLSTSSLQTTRLKMFVFYFKIYYKLIKK